MTGQKASSNDCRPSHDALKKSPCDSMWHHFGPTRIGKLLFSLFFVPMVYKTIHMDWPFMHVEPLLGTHCSGPERATKSLRWSK